MRACELADLRRCVTFGLPMLLAPRVCAVLVVLTLCMPISQRAIAASATDIEGDSPETAIAEFYRLMSFEAGSRPDYDAVVLVSATSESIELIDADESMRRIQQKIEESGLEDYGLLRITQ